jgi:hypothetical protein
LVRSALALLAAAVLLSATAAEGRQAAYAPSIVIRGDGRASFQVVLTDLLGDGVETARTDVYVPRGWQIDTSVPVGTHIGFVLTFASSGFSGYVEVVDPALYTDSPCAQSPHNALWRLVKTDNVGLYDQAFVAVDRVDEAYAAYRLTVCPPTPPGGARRTLLQFQIDDIIRAPAGRGESIWRAVFAPSSGVAVEGRSLVRLPVRVTIDALRYVERTKTGRRTRVLVHGRVTEAGKAPVQGGPGGGYGVEVSRSVVIGGPFMYLGVVRADAAGRFSARVRDRGGRFYRVRTVHVGIPGGRPAPAGLCARPWLAPGDCVHPNLWEFYVTSPVAQVH